MQSIWKCGLAFGVALCLAGCVAGTQASDSQTPASAPAPAGKGGEAEAPNVYTTTDLGLWDGRPSLGGVWVAATNVKDPEHVLIRNLANGKSVSGALFRRERNNPGPRIQVSSEAAQALGMLAGAPARLSVVALRRAEPSAPPPAASAPVKAQPGAAAATTKGTPAKPAVAATATAAKPAAPSPTPVATAPVSAAASAPVAAVASASGPFVQLGTYSVEANARASAAKVGKSGLSAAVQSGQTGKKEMWRVIVIPTAGTDARALLSKVKGLGFPDAYIVTK